MRQSVSVEQLALGFVRAWSSPAILTIHGTGVRGCTSLGARIVRTGCRINLLDAVLANVQSKSAKMIAYLDVA